MLHHWLISHVLGPCLCKSVHRFFCKRADKKGHYKVTGRLYLTYLWAIPTQPGSTKIAIWVRVADIINHTKFDYDRSKQYKVMEVYNCCVVCDKYSKSLIKYTHMLENKQTSVKVRHCRQRHNRKHRDVTNTGKTRPQLFWIHYHSRKTKQDD